MILSSTRQANHHHVKPAGDSAGQPLNRVFERYRNAQHVLAVDPFTLAALKVHVEMPGRERGEFGPDYQDHGVLFCWENGTPPHPDTITRRFKRLAAAAGLPEIDLHDVRHSYATAGREAKID